MPILAAYMVPHPPMIVPAVGRGSEEQIRPTIDAYTRVAREIAALAPDTVIVSSPHALGPSPRAPSPGSGRERSASGRSTTWSW